MLKLYNTLTRKKEKFVPIKRGKVGLYTCGPTVYWFGHAGNMRAYIFADVLRKTYKSLSIVNISNLRVVNMLPGDLWVAGCFFLMKSGGYVNGRHSYFR